MRRIPELDALRGIAAFLIMIFHLRLSQKFPYWGSLVDLFFVLSGYLITTIILDTSRTEHFLRNFYIRRALRIWPIYYLSIPVAILLNWMAPRPESLAALGNYLTFTQFIQGYWFAPSPPFNGALIHTWTLAIEEQFYLFWPLLVGLTGRKYLPVVVAPLLVVPTLMRTFGFPPFLLLTRCEGLALGAVLAYLGHDRTWWLRHRAKLRLVFIALIVAMVTYGRWSAPVFATVGRAWPSPAWGPFRLSLDMLRVCLFYFGIVGWVLCDHGHPALVFLRGPVLTYLGKISYGVYLYHRLVFQFLAMIHHGYGIRGSFGMDVLKVAACLAVAALSWEYIEKPILTLKDRFAPVRAPGAGSGALRGPHAGRRRERTSVRPM